MRTILFIGGVAATLSFPAPGEEPHPRELEEVVVTAAPIASGTRSMAQPASVLSGDELTRALAPTIGETVSGEAGVRSTFFGPAASRPVIRGLGGDRVLVLTDGLATTDASGLSEDHAVAIDPALADQVEILRGPATLLHGSGAAGGLVNVVTNRLHRHVHESPSGLVELRGDSALGERAAAGRFDAGAGRFALHVDSAWRETDDYEVPGFVESRRLRAEHAADGEVPGDERGTVENSWSRTHAGAVGSSFVGERWQLGVAASRHDTRYGVPVAHHHEHEGEEEEVQEGGISIDLVQDRLDFRAGAALGGSDAPALEVRGAWTDYEHAEIEPEGAIGTLFEVDGRELRATIDHGRTPALDGTVGAQWKQVELVAVGEEAFVPDTVTRTEGVFAFQRRQFASGSLEYGLRADRQRVSGVAGAGYDELAVNASFGGLRQLADRFSLVGHVARSERHPSATELYANGPHAATQQFEVGDAELDTERGVTAELGLRFDGPRLGGELRAFATRYEGYIFLAPTGAQLDELPVFEYRQRDARFRGLEAELELPLGGNGRYTLAFTGEYVRGNLAGAGDVPRLPPLALGTRIAFDNGRIAAGVGLTRHFEQDRTAALELPTDPYTMLEADLMLRPGWAGPGTTLFLRARNLLDEDARMHTSPLKDRLPLPGRSIGAGIRVSFGG